jgi:hypothetical protein
VVVAVVLLIAAAPSPAHHKAGHEHGRSSASAEHGKSGVQGKSESDPDDDGHGPDRSNGGADKPGGPGEEDVTDQDGNNGCGNDADFEDDNEGWCGRNPKAGGAVGAGRETNEIGVPGEESGAIEDTGADKDDAASGAVGNVTGPTTPASVLDTRVANPSGATDVAAGSAQRSAGASVLPFTGANMVFFVVLAAASMLGGAIALRARVERS